MLTLPMPRVSSQLSFKEDCTRLLLVTLFLLSSACATTGPQITTEEERRAQAILQAEAQAWQRKQEQKILEVAARLMRTAENVTPLKFHFAAKPEDTGGRINPDSVNAWTDGSSVWISRGMMRFLKNDDELAIVLAHEMAHAYRGHMAYVRTKQVLGLALGIAAEIFAPGTGRSVMMLADAATKKFDRDQERESDLYGLIWVHKAGFKVEVAKEVWRRMAVEMPESAETGFLSSHPSSAERLLAMEKVAETLNKGLDPIKVFAPKEQEKMMVEKEEAPSER